MTTNQKIESFAKLRAGWHVMDEGIAFDGGLIAEALDLNALLHSIGIRETDAFPGTDGSIQVTAYPGGKYLEFTIEPDGEIQFCYEWVLVAEDD